MSLINAGSVLGGREAAEIKAQIAAKLSTVDAPTTVRDTALTGLSTATTTPVVPTDTVLVAAGKLQAQVTAQKRRARVPAVAGRFYTSCNFGGTFTSGTVGASQRRTSLYEPLSDIQINQIGIVLDATAGAAGAAVLSLYEFDVANPAQLNLLHNFGEITVDTAIGAKMITANYSFFVGRTYVFVLHISQAFNLRSPPATSNLATGLLTADGAQNILWRDTPAYSATPAPTLDTSAMVALTTNATLIVMRAA